MMTKAEVRPSGRAASSLHWLLLSLPALLGPWCFGAWEMWWFWPFAVALFAATVVFACRLLAAADEVDSPVCAVPSFGGSRATRRLLLACLPFLTYAAARCLAAEVALDAERSFLLFLTPFLMGWQLLCGFGRRERRQLHRALLLNLLALGLYGLLNHALTGSRLVLWAPGYERYYSEQRACGSFFCPDHFAGAMVLAAAQAVALLGTRCTPRPWRWLGWALLAVAAAGVFASKSRGGGLTLAVLAGAALVWAFPSWPPPARRNLRAALLAVCLAGLGLMAVFGKPYVSRFGEFFDWERARRQGSPAEARAVVMERVRDTARYRMMSAAFRSWRRQPVFGIGPGMHQNVWPAIAPSPDGDRETGRWPAFPGYTYHSYQVHNDWLQLLQEYGLIGLFLFLIPVFTVATRLLKGLRTTARPRAPCGEADWQRHAAVSGGWLAAVAFAFYSLGDFNLQIPGNNWMFAALLSLGLGAAGQRSSRDA